MSTFRNEFEAYIEKFKKDESYLEDIKRLFDDKRIDTIEAQELSDVFLNVSEACGYFKSIGYAYIIKTWIAYARVDYQLAEECNKQAEIVFKTLEEAEKNLGMLAVVNNKLLIFIALDNLERAYEQTRIGYYFAGLCNRQTDLVYYMSTASNILCEIGLVDKAVKAIIPFVKSRKEIGLSCYLQVIHDLCIYNLKLENYEEVRNYLEIVEEEAKTIAEYDIYFNAIRCELSLQYGQNDDALKYIEEINKRNSILNENARCRLYASLAQARYNAAIKNIDEAVSNYIKVINSLNYFLGIEAEILEEVSKVYAEDKDYLEAYFHMKGAQEKRDKYLVLKKTLQNQDREDNWEDFTATMYQSLYERTNILTTIAQKILATLNFAEIYKELHENINKIVAADAMSLLVYDKECGKYCYAIDTLKGRTRHDTVDIKSNNSLVGYCINNKKELFLNNAKLQQLDYIKEEDKALVDSEVNALIYIPVYSNAMVTGALCVESYSYNGFQDYEINLLKILADYIGIALDNAKNYTQAINTSNHDFLTGMLNRNGFIRSADLVINNIKKRGGHVGILMMDLDDFKHINDTYGHVKGDDVIKTVSQKIGVCLSMHEAVGRYGGEEFVAVIPVESVRELAYIGDTVRKSVQNTRMLDTGGKGQKLLSCSISVGGYFGDANESLVSSIDKADQALYIAKQNGKNCIKIYNDEFK
ncbi:MAG: sensor domain-containing diguanylate cyclase [Erysipelotrichaceae bacterium]